MAIHNAKRYLACPTEKSLAQCRESLIPIQLWAVKIREGVTMSNLAGLAAVVSELRKERANHVNELKHLDAALSVLGKLHGGSSYAEPRRTLSAAGRRKISLAQKARWAKARGQAPKPKRTMSAAGTFRAAIDDRVGQHLQNQGQALTDIRDGIRERASNDANKEQWFPVFNLLAFMGMPAHGRPESRASACSRCLLLGW